MRRGVKKYIEKRSPATFPLQITSMVDMFTILLVFLLKSFSTSPVQLAPAKNLDLPNSTSFKEPVEVLRMIVSKDGVFVEDKQVMDLKNGAIRTEDLDASDPQFLKPLYNELDKQAEHSRTIAKLNETVQFDGRVIVQADKTLSYSVLKKVMYTSMLAGYADVKLAVVSLE